MTTRWVVWFDQIQRTNRALLAMKLIMARVDIPKTTVAGVAMFRAEFWDFLVGWNRHGLVDDGRVSSEMVAAEVNRGHAVGERCYSIEDWLLNGYKGLSVRA